MNSGSIGQPDPALSLALAMVESSMSPLLLLDGALCVIGASASFCAAFGIPSDAVVGRLLAQVGNGEWASPQLASLLKATVDGAAEIESYQMDLDVEGRETQCLVISARKLRYGDGTSVRLLVAVQDMTDQRAADRQRDNLVR